MDYEKKYKEALGWMQSLYKGLHGVTKEDAEHFFPELKESKEERNQRIKKEVIEMLNYYHSKSNCFNPPQFSLKETLAWLEKQGEQNHCNGEVNDEALQRQFQIWFDKGKCSGRDEVIFHPEDFGLKKQDEQKSIDSYCQENCKGFQETGKCFADGECKAKRDAEQNPDWSEEDEKHCRYIIDFYLQKSYGATAMAIEWLKNLKNRMQPHWKPTEEQMEAFYWMKRYPAGEFAKKDILNSLYNDLKKL